MAVWRARSSVYRCAVLCIANSSYNHRLQIPQKKGDPVVVTKDEESSKSIDPAKLKALRSAFKKDGAWHVMWCYRMFSFSLTGTITAANASKLNDGAAALVVVSREAAEKLGLKPLALIRGGGVTV